MNKITVDSEFINNRLDVFLTQRLDFSRSHIKNMIENNYIFLNGDAVKKSGIKLKENDIIEYKDVVPKKLDVLPQNIDINIVYEDDDMAVINKPQGLVVHPANGNEDNTLVNALLYHLKNLSSINGVIRPGIVHRLDKDTSGLLIIAKNDKAHVFLAKQIQEKTCHRHYIALLNGNLKQDNGTIQTYIGRSKKDRKKMAVVDENEGKIAITNYKVLERYSEYTLVEFILQTGRTHQIRVHANYIGHSVVGDKTYGNKCKFKINGQLLHAYKIEFNRPSDNKRMIITCPLPDYFQKILNYCKNMKN